MSEQKHTPGPWTYYADLPSIDPDWHIVTNASRMRVIANINIEPGNAMDIANARLIAAAPDLLALAQQYATECGECAGTGVKPDDEPCDECAFIRGVIAKATGSAASDTGAK